MFSENQLRSPENLELPVSNSCSRYSDNGHLFRMGQIAHVLFVGTVTFC